VNMIRHYYEAENPAPFCVLAVVGVPANNLPNQGYELTMNKYYPCENKKKQTTTYNHH
jgi:hypothetical protein